MIFEQNFTELIKATMKHHETNEANEIYFLWFLMVLHVIFFHFYFGFISNAMV